MVSGLGFLVSGSSFTRRELNQENTNKKLETGNSELRTLNSEPEQEFYEKSAQWSHDYESGS